MDMTEHNLVGTILNEHNLKGMAASWAVWIPAECESSGKEKGGSYKRSDKECNICTRQREPTVRIQEH